MKKHLTMYKVYLSALILVVALIPGSFALGQETGSSAVRPGTVESITEDINLNAQTAEIVLTEFVGNHAQMLKRYETALQSAKDAAPELKPEREAEARNALATVLIYRREMLPQVANEFAKLRRKLDTLTFGFGDDGEMNSFRQDQLNALQDDIDRYVREDMRKIAVIAAINVGYHNPELESKAAQVFQDSNRLTEMVDRMHTQAPTLAIEDQIGEMQDILWSIEFACEKALVFDHELIQATHIGATVNRIKNMLENLDTTIRSFVNKGFEEMLDLNIDIDDVLDLHDSAPNINTQANHATGRSPDQDYFEKLR